MRPRTKDLSLRSHPLKASDVHMTSRTADADGGLTISVQKESPGADKESNWLPGPDGQFFLILRTYLPAES